MTTIDQDGKLINKVITAQDVQDIMRDAEVILFDDTRETLLTNKITQIIKDRLGVFDSDLVLEEPDVITSVMGVPYDDPLIRIRQMGTKLISPHTLFENDPFETEQRTVLLKQENSRSQGLFPSKYKLDHSKKNTRVSTTKLAKRKKQAAQKRARKITKLCK